MIIYTFLLLIYSIQAVLLPSANDLDTTASPEKEPSQIIHPANKTMGYVAYTSAERDNRNVTIKPNATHALFVRITQSSSYVNIYQILPDGGEPLFLYPIHFEYEQYEFKLAIGSGLLVIPKLRSGGYYYDYERFRLIYERILPDKNDTSYCPNPLIQAEPGAKKIAVATLWSNPGCAFRITARAGHYVAVKSVAHSTRIEARSPFSATVIWSVEGDRLSSRWSSFKRFRSIVNRNIVEKTPVDIRFLMESGYKASAEEDFIFITEIKENPCSCSSQKITVSLDDNTTLTSPGFPNQYCGGFECTYTIETDARSDDDFDVGFLLTIDLLGATENFDDTLNIMSTDIDFPKGHVKQLGIVTENQLVLALGHVMDFKYTTGDKLTDHGFSVQAKPVAIPNECLCPSRVTKLIQPDEYFYLEVPATCPIMVCEFALRSFAVLRSTIEYKFASPDEYIEFRFNQGGAYTRKRIQANSTDSDFAVLYEKVTGDTVRVQFVRNLPEEPGEISFFNLTYAKPTSTAKCECGQSEFISSNRVQVLTSPNYPSQYCDNMRCNYTIRSENNERISMNITHFRTESQRDKLTIFDGAKKIQELHGKLPKQTLISNSSTIIMNFTSDYNEALSGFIIYYSIDPAGQSATEAAARTSPSDYSIAISPFLIIVLLICFSLILMAVVVNIVIFTRRRRQNSDPDSGVVRFVNPIYDTENISIEHQ